MVSICKPPKHSLCAKQALHDLIQSSAFHVNLSQQLKQFIIKFHVASGLKVGLQL